MLDRLGNEVDFTEMFMEETLSSKDKKTIPDDQWGLIIKNDKGEIVERKFPLNDETHVRQAAIFFDRAKGLSDDQKRELARNIVRRAKELDMDYSGWESLKPYLDKSVKESFMTYEWLMKQNYPDLDSTSGTSEFDDSDHEPDDCYTESFEEMFGPVIQEAYDAITGEEIQINHAYTMEEMKEITFSESELKHIKHNDEIEHVNKIFFDECYFASPIDYGKSMTLDDPLFVTPYKAIASIFCGRDKVKESIPKIGTYNLGYKEWTDFKVPGANKNQINKPLREVHVYIEGYPFLESKTIEAEGFIHCINAKKYDNNFYKYPWMDKLDREYLIANTDGNKVEFTRTIKCKVRYIIEGRQARLGQDDLGPRPNGLTHWIHEIANKIHTKYKADQKEPTGNQNCLLCSWCAEAQMRGQDYLPRPIYSPRDSALEIVPGDIVGGVTKKNPGSFNDMLNIIKKESSNQPFTRWYCHVKWGDGNGGHEFLIVKIDDNSFVIMDAQQGVVRPLTADDSYMKNADWKGTYICRIDDRPFKYMKFDKINDPKKTLPWDPKKDIPYMVKNGLCTKEEAEKELKKTETNLFTSELKKALNQTPIQESHTDLLDETFYRFEYDGEGIYEALRKNMSVDDWKDFKQSKAATWLPIPPNYQIGDQSFFTEKGHDKFMNLTYPYMTKYLKKSKIRKFETELNPKYIRYRDEYQVVFNKTKTFQESTIQESALDPTTIIPKDLRDWLKKGDYSSLEKDDSYYYVEGHPVEEFWIDPEFARSAFYLDDKNDPSYDSIVFSDDNGNGLIYDPTDGWYYYLYHDWTDDDTGFLHRERLSSKSWTQIIDPTHAKNIKDSKEKRSEILKELTHLTANPIYDDIKYGATNSHFGKGFFKSDCSAMEKRWNAIGHEWCNAVEDFADKYKFSELSETIDIFANKTMSLFVPTIGSHVYDIEAYKEGAKNVIKAFQDVEKSLKEYTIQESAWGDIRNGVNPWSMKRVFHISPEGHLDGQIFKPRVPEYLDKYDPSKTEFEDVETPRVCFSPSIEGCLNAIIVNIGRWKTANKLRDWYVYIPEKPLKEYKYRTNKQLIDEKKVYDANLTKEIWIEEPVRLKQYGIIRIDSVTDVNRKKAVPTTLGESKKRNVYDFKWHWLVKPKILKDIPYDYSPKSVCEDMVNELSGFKYGLGYDGSIHKGSSKDYDEKYRLESPEEFEKNGGGICYDYVEWEEGYLEAYGYTCRKFFISTDTEDMDTHTFILVDDGNGKFIYPEAAFKLLEGTHTVKFLDEAVDMIMKKVWDINDNKSKYDKIKYYVWEYKGHPPYGSDMKTCHEYFTKGEPIGEGMFKNPYKRKE